MNGKRGSVILLVTEVSVLIVTVILCFVRVLNPMDTGIQKETRETAEAVAESADSSNWNQDAELQDVQSQDSEPQETDSKEEESQETESENESEEIEEIAEAVDRYPQEAWEKLSTMTMEERIAQMFIVAPEAITQVTNQTVAGPSTESNYGRYPVGGFVFNNNNYNGDERSKALLEGVEVIAYNRIGLNTLTVFRERTGENKVAVADTFNGEEVFELYKKTTFGEIPQKAHLIPTYQGEFIDTAGYQILMVSNENNQELTDTDIPICFIPNQYEAIREAYGAYILLMTESLSDDRIRKRYSSGESAILAINAGADLIYRPDNFMKAYDEVVSAVADGRITEERIDEAVIRIITYKMNFEAYTQAPKRTFPVVHSTGQNSNTRNTNTQNANTQNPEEENTDYTQQPEQSAGNGEQAQQTQQPAGAQQQTEAQQQPTSNPEIPQSAGSTQQ